LGRQRYTYTKISEAKFAIEYFTLLKMLDNVRLVQLIKAAPLWGRRKGGSKGVYNRTRQMKNQTIAAMSFLQP